MNSVSQVVLGIGNIGSKYDGTRHNIGFDVVDLLIKDNDTVEKRVFKHSEAFILELGGEKTVLLKPNTYVNLSGLAAEEVLNEYDLTVEDMLVVVDDFHLPLGNMRFRGKGSAGGHNGLKSLIETCGGTFSRLRFGIGPLPEGESIVDFVLGRFEEDEQEPYSDALAKAVEAVPFYLENGLYDTMNKFNS